METRVVLDYNRSLPLLLHRSSVLDPIPDQVIQVAYFHGFVVGSLVVATPDKVR